MHLLITGASGLIGRHLVHTLRHQHQLTLISRDPVQTRQLFQDPLLPVFTLQNLPALQNVDVVINLAGAPIADQRWRPAYKQAICDSRWQTTQALLACCRQSDHPPRLWLNASAVGWYGSQRHWVDETCTHPTSGFTHEVCARWEQLAMEAEHWGARVCLLRLGPVLASEGGMLSKLLPLYRQGLGSRLGDGQQYLPWISLPDALAAIYFLLEHDTCQGPFNLCAPHPLRQIDFSQQLAEHLLAAHWLQSPAWLLQLLLGERASLLLDNLPILPRRLQDAGFHFQHPQFTDALQALLPDH